MTCCSLRHGDVELLGERHGLAGYAGCGITMGASLMHPWANRLSSWSYTACGSTVRLPVSPLLHTDQLGLPINGVQSCGHAWVIEDTGAASESAWLDAVLPFDSDPRQLELFPFPHRVRVNAEVTGCRCASTSRSRRPAACQSPSALDIACTCAVSIRTVMPRSFCPRGSVS
jgi:hypothetical protein